MSKYSINRLYTRGIPQHEAEHPGVVMNDCRAGEFRSCDSVRRREPDELAQHLALRVRVALDREVVRLEDVLVPFLCRPREHGGSLSQASQLVR